MPLFSSKHIVQVSLTQNTWAAYVVDLAGVGTHWLKCRLLLSWHNLVPPTSCLWKNSWLMANLKTKLIHWIVEMLPFFELQVLISKRLPSVSFYKTETAVESSCREQWGHLRGSLWISSDLQGRWTWTLTSLWRRKQGKKSLSGSNILLKWIVWHLWKHSLSSRELNAKINTIVLQAPLDIKLQCTVSLQYSTVQYHFSPFGFQTD